MHILFSLLITLISFNSVAFANFSDVPEKSATHQAILYLKNADILRGDPGGTFRPTDKINRAEFTAIVIRSLHNANIETNCTNKPAFKDVAQNSWYYQDVCEAFNAELIQGYDDGTFKPEQTITLAEAAKIVAISYDLNPQEVERSKPWYKAGLQYLSEYSALPTFLPKQDQPITREQMAEILFRMEVEVDKPSLDIGDFDIPNDDSSEYNANTNGKDASATTQYCDDLLEYEDEWTEEDENDWYDNCEDDSVDMEYCDDLLEYEDEWTEEDENDWYDNCEDDYYDENEALDYDEDSDEWFTMTEDECLEDEVYDAVEQMCYIELDCDTDEECDALIAEYEGEFEEILDNEQQDYEEYDYDSESTTEIATYSINGSNIAKTSSKSPKVDSWMLDEQNHKEIWNFYANLVPNELRTHVTSFVVSTDGKDGELAAVAAEDDITQWTLYIDIADAYTDKGNTIDTDSFAYSLIHEQMHLISLKDGEYSSVATRCTTYEIDEGCLRSESILYRFYKSFWLKHASTLVKSNSEDAMYEYYQKHTNEFVSDYASSSPVEDIAETFAEFVLRDRPTGNTLAEQKIQFFYKEPTLVDLRTLLRNRLKSVVSK
jgi:S-layer homology domain